MRINKLSITTLLGLSAVLLANTASAAITTYTDKATFLSMLQPGYFEDAFNDVTNGGITGVSSIRSGGGYSVTYTAPPGGLFSTDGAMSTNNAANNLIATMGGANIYAVGGNFFLTDINGIFQTFAGNNISAFASNGIDANATLSALNSANGISTFFGWISTTPITSITVNAGGSSPSRWNTLDNFIVGSAAPLPEPTTLTLLILGGAAFVRRRKSS